MDSIKAKVIVNSVENFGHSERPKMSPVTGGSPEDNNYSQATPGGSLELYISNPAAFGFFKSGKKYHVTFTEAVEV